MKAFYTDRIQRRLARHLNNWRIFQMARRVESAAPQAKGQPIIFFKASSGLDDLSWNSAFHLLVSWGLRLQGAPVIFFACKAGMSRCVLGTDRERPEKAPPCRSCMYQSSTLYTGADARPFSFRRDAELEKAIGGLSLAELVDVTWQGVPLGALCLPGLRWILRRHNLLDDETTRFFLREYILSAWTVATAFESLLEQTHPQALVVFNGQFYPEATAKWVATQRGVRVMTHEVGLQPMSGFFTNGEATAYPISIPESFELNDEQNARLDAYLQKRFQGNFSMAGIKFWPDIKGLDEVFLAKAAGFKKLVPVFTNVIFDTSQPHANTVFTDMFVWLDLVLDVARTHPETLFVIRAHPDETRPGKESQESVAAWAAARGVAGMPNVMFVPPREFLSSYELIARAAFVLIYNSTIGLEASIMGAAVLSAGKARFTQYPSVFFPQSVDEYRAMLERFLKTDKIDVPVEFRRNARRFLYTQLFRTSLPFGDFLERGILPVNARLKMFDPAQLLPENSPALAAVTKGLLAGGDFLLEE
ncbi:MAG: hypothetical protein WA821_16300 [Anaerolineales bacterium]